MKLLRRFGIGRDFLKTSDEGLGKNP